MSSTNPSNIFDAGKRVLRTVVQVAAGFLAVAPVYPLLVAAIGAPSGSTAAVWLAAVGAVVTGTATVLSRLMAIPAVNALLGTVGLAGHSGSLASADTSTRMFAAVRASAND